MPPLRTCIACRRRAPASELLRLADVGGALAVEPTHRSAGRGAWLCPTTTCVAHIERHPERLARALGGPSRGSLEEEVGRSLNTAATAALPAALAGGCLSAGQEKVAAGLQKGSFAAVIVASNASTRLVGGCAVQTGATPIVRLDLTSRELGNLIGKGPRAVLGVRPGAHSRALLAVLRHCASLGYHPGQHRTGARPEATRRHGITRSRGQGPRNLLPPEVVPEGSPTSAENTLRREGSVCPRKRF